MSPHQGKFIAYFRVSTDKQGKSGLGLQAQRKAVLDYLDGGRCSLVQEFVEIESGKHNERPQLAAALAACKKHKARLVIAKLDRLSRNLAFIATLMESGVEFVAVDNPHATKLTVHILAAVAEHEREMISERTRAALRAAKARGTRLGNPQLAKEQRTQVWRVFNLNPDCTAADVIVAKVTKQGKGQVEFEENLGYSAYPKDSQKYRCNTQQTAGLSIFYTSPTEFKGTDSFEIEIVGGHGQSRKSSFRVRVK
jgi:DNA invertase Pin-like site-specific DNA recombinase